MHKQRRVGLAVEAVVSALECWLLYDVAFVLVADIELNYLDLLIFGQVVVRKHSRSALRACCQPLDHALLNDPVELVGVAALEVDSVGLWLLVVFDFL